MPSGLEKDGRSLYLWSMCPRGYCFRNLSFICSFPFFFAVKKLMVFWEYGSCRPATQIVGADRWNFFSFCLLNHIFFCFPAEEYFATHVTSPSWMKFLFQYRKIMAKILVAILLFLPLHTHLVIYLGIGNGLLIISGLLYSMILLPSALQKTHDFVQLPQRC